MKRIVIYTMFIVSLIGCSKDEDASPTPSNPNDSMYFPPISGSEWETSSITTLGWDENALEALKAYLISTHSRSFMILVNGKIVVEEYFNGHTASDTWQWNSAGKSLVSAAIGLSQQQGLIDIDDKVSDYLGNGWTNTAQTKEDLITIKHLLSMTSGLDDKPQLVIPQNLKYIADAGTRWAYGNVFQRLMNIIEESSNEKFETHFKRTLSDKIGMDGYWKTGLIYTLYHSTTRDMARFGLLALNNGKWDKNQVIDADYFAKSITSSQDINPSYGYLWWLNGKSKYMVPGSQEVYSGSIVHNAADDMFAAMGANDQRIYIVPSKKMVVIRMGEAANPNESNFAISSFDNVLWEKINDLVN